MKYKVGDQVTYTGNGGLFRAGQVGTIIQIYDRPTMPFPYYVKFTNSSIRMPMAETEIEGV